MCTRPPLLNTTTSISVLSELLSLLCPEKQFAIARWKDSADVALAAGGDECVRLAVCYSGHLPEFVRHVTS